MNKKYLVTALSILTLSQPLLPASAKPIRESIKEHPVISSVIVTMCAVPIVYLCGKAIASKSDTNDKLFEGKIDASQYLIREEAFNKRYDLTKVVIPDGIMQIGRMAFANCKNLTDIVIPSSVRIISEGAFGGCQNLTQITIPSSISLICEWAFCGCKNLTQITIPSSVKRIHKYTFCLCENLTNINLSDGILMIDDGVFQDCKSIETITIPNSVRYIAESSFEGCGNLKQINYGGIKYSSFSDFHKAFLSKPGTYKNQEDFLNDYCGKH